MRGIFLFPVLALSVGGCLAPSLFLSPAFADTVHYKNRNELKGLVVEKHADRIILSTEQGELPIMLKDIAKIDYDDPAQNFVELGKKSEAENSLGVALAYYEKAVELNPNHEEAKRAALSVRNRFWASNNERPLSEVEKQQNIYDSWGTGRPIDEVTRARSSEQVVSLKTGLGLTLEKKGDWVRLTNVDSKKDGFAAGLKKNDRLVSIDSQSLRYLTEPVVAAKLLAPRLTNCSLELERDIYIRVPDEGTGLKALGFKLKLEYEGLFVRGVKKDSPAQRAGLRDGDLVVRIGDAATRYLPIQKAVDLIQQTDEEGVPVTIRRTTLFARK